MHDNSKSYQRLPEANQPAFKRDVRKWRAQSRRLYYLRERGNRITAGISAWSKSQK